VMLIKKADISTSKTDRTRFLNNGISSMLNTGREIQRRENSTRDSDCTSKDHSILSQEWVDTDTLVLLTESSSSRPEMEDLTNMDLLLSIIDH
jgi:hypothetical protein